MATTSQKDPSHHRTRRAFGVVVSERGVGAEGLTGVMRMRMMAVSLGHEGLARLAVGGHTGTGTSITDGNYTPPPLSSPPLSCPCALTPGFLHAALSSPVLYHHHHPLGVTRCNASEPREPHVFFFTARNMTPVDRNILIS